MAEMRVLYFDVETAPMLTRAWNTRDWIGHQMILHDQHMLSWAAKWRGQSRIRSDVVTPEEALARDDSRITASLIDLVRDADLVIAHNADKFDVPTLRTRAIDMGLEPIGPVKSIDTLKVARRDFKFASNRLDYIARKLKVGAKMDTGGYGLWEHAVEGDAQALRKMRKYNKQDVVVLEAVFEAMLPHMSRVPRLWRAHGLQCVYCGHYNLHRRGFRDTAVYSYVRMQCVRCRRYQQHRNSTSREGGEGARPELRPI